MLQNGSFLADRYEIIDRIGTGGMSEVYKAKDHILDRNIAIKVLKAEFAQDMTFVNKFRTEAQSAAGLEHPNIVNIYDVGSQDGIYFIIMEYIEGITLKTYIEKKGKLTFKEAVSIGIQVSRGIEAAHNKGIVHRDIKPQNIMISSEGKVKVTDFGIARASSGNTVSTEAMGSVHYISPEQARNGFVDGRTDIYSLGIVMYEMLSGHVPFDGENAISIAIQHLQNEITPPSAYVENLPVSIEGIILKCTQKSPDKRYASIGELIIDLKKSLINPDEPVAVIPVSHGDEPAPARRMPEPEREYDDDDEYEDDEDIDDDDEDDDEDGFMSPKAEKILTIIGIVAAAIIVMVIIYIGGSMLGFFGNKDKDDDTEPVKTEQVTAPEEEGLEMPNIIGMSEEQAKEMLKTLGLGYKLVGYESSDTVIENMIASQSVDPGEIIPENTTVEVRLSSGKGEITIPDVVGKTQADATAALKEAGFEVETASASSDNVEEGKVLSSKPAAGYLLKAGETVTITISSGQDLIKVPSGIVGKGQTEATKLITDAGLKWSVAEEYSDTVEAGYVVTCTPAEGTAVKKQSTIAVVVSKGTTMTTVPNLANLSEDDIKAALEKEGLVYERSEVYSTDGTTPGSLVSWTPGAGESVKRGSTVKVVWSLGKGVTLPSGLLGIDQETAVWALENAGFKIDLQNIEIVESTKNDLEGLYLEDGTAVALDSVTVYPEGTTLKLKVGSGTSTSQPVPVPDDTTAAPQQ